MINFKEYVEEPANRFNALYITVFIIFIYLIYAILIYYIRDIFEISLNLSLVFTVISTIILSATTYIIKLKVMYNYNKIFLVGLLIATYFVIPLFLFDNINYLNLQEYINDFTSLFREISFLMILLINVNVFFLPFMIDKQFKNRDNILYEDNQIKLIEQTNTYVKIFNTKSELSIYLEKLKDYESKNTFPLNQFTKLDKTEMENEHFYITLQYVRFKNSKIFRLILNEKNKTNRLNRINIYTNLIYER